VSEEIVKVPDIGDASGVEVIELCVAPGQHVEKDSTLIVLESDKASMEIPSPESGSVGSIFVHVGSKVSQGDDILVLNTATDQASVVEEKPTTQTAEVNQQEEPSSEAVQAVEASSGLGANIEVLVPDIGDVKDVEVIEVAVKEGDNVEKDATLIVLESDKASMEIPAPQAGVVKTISVGTGDKVSEGSLILVLAAASQADTGATTKQETAKTAEAAPAANQSKREEPLTIKVPDIGDASEVEVIEVTVAVGDSVAVDDTLIVLESDKASMEIPATHAGTVAAVLLEVGQKVKQGAPIVVLTQASSSAASLESPVKKDSPSQLSSPAKPSPAAEPAAVSQQVPPAKSGKLVYAGPAVRMLARELGVDLTQVKASGPRERIIKEDVQNFVKQALREKSKASPAGSGMPSVPAIDFSQFGEIKVVPMSRVKKLTAAAMHRSWLNVPHVTHFDEADISDLEEFRISKKSQATERGLKLTPLPFLIKACAAALKKYPQFNVALAPSGEEIIQKFYFNIGIAMDTPAGLMVPVIRNADKKGVWELAEETTELGVKGQAGKLSKEDLQGGCFTISSLGSIGGTGFTPIVNTPEVAILGVSKTQVKPVFINSEFLPRQLLPLTLSYDHRAINGVDAGQFMTFLTQVLADIRKLVL